MTVFVRHPVDNPRITQPFGAKNTWEAQPHMGVDYGAPEGTPIYAPCDGFVVWASFDAFHHGNTWEMIPGSGNSGGCVIIQPPAPHTALQTSFSHMSQILVKPGQWVTAGTMIGRVGNTGFSFGAHLHWEAFIDYAEGVYPAGTYWGRVNPLDYFNTATIVPLGTGGKGSPNVQEEEIVPNHNDRVFDAIDGSKVTLNELLNQLDRQTKESRDLSRAALQAVGGILATRIPDPTDRSKSYTIADYIVWAATNAKTAAGNAGQAVTNTSPENLAKAVSEAQSSVTAQSVAEQLTVNITTKEN